MRWIPEHEVFHRDRSTAFNHSRDLRPMRTQLPHGQCSKRAKSRAEAVLPRAVSLANLSALYAWYAEWTEVARAVVSRRADRILLGIAKQRKKGGADETMPTATAPVAASAPQA